MKGQGETFYSVVGYRKETTYILAENATFDEALTIFEKRGEQFENMNIVEEKHVASTPKNLLVIANAEGMLQETKELLERPLKLKETFLFLGNYTASAPGFYLYMNFLADLRKKRKCIFVKGVNEHNLLECISGRKEYIGNLEEVEMFLSSIEEELSFPLKSLPKRFPAMYALLEDAVDFFENDTFIFTPGGLDLGIPYWKQTEKEKRFFTTEEFLITKNETGKRIVFGGIPVTELTTTETLRPWMNSSQDKIAINGGCRHGGKLYGMSLLDGEISFMGVRGKTGRDKRAAYRQAEKERKEALGIF